MTNPSAEEPRAGGGGGGAASEVVSGMTDLLAFYADQNGDGNDGEQWAVRAGTCAASTNTMFGNVDGKSTLFSWNGADFSASIDTTTVANGSYCFVFNPTEDAGNIDQRLTRTFTIDNAPPAEPGEPTTSSETVIVTPDAMQGWAFVQETALGSGSLVSGPLTAPLGFGSANLVVDGAGGELFGAPNHAGVRLADITKLAYSTYRALGSAALAPSIQLNIDKDIADLDDTWQGRLVYEPYYRQTVESGSWQEWDALDDAAGTGTGNWWFSNAGLASESGCTQENPCTWTEVKTAFPNIGIHPTLGAVGFKAGSNWAGGFDGNVDAFVIGIQDGLNTHTTTYDFEPEEAEDIEEELFSAPLPGGNMAVAASVGNVLGASTDDEGEVLGASTDGEVLGNTCPLIRSFLGEGLPNDPDQVMSLQEFLIGEIGSGLPTTGFFGPLTPAAVKAFQLKY